MKIMLVCNAGVSTSIVVKKMQESAVEKQLNDITIYAVPTAEGINRTDEPDLILLGPQVRFYLKQYQDAVKGRIPVGIIETRDYGRLLGEKILDTALKTIAEFKAK